MYSTAKRHTYLLAVLFWVNYLTFLRFPGGNNNNTYLIYSLWTLKEMIKV